MATVAEQLRRGREAGKLSVLQVADITKMKTDHVRALEEGDYNAFVAPVYIRGFVRTYAGLLRLNVPEVMTALEAELGQTEKFSEPPSLPSSPPGPVDAIMLWLSRINWRIALPVLAVGLAALLGAWGFRAWQSQREKDPLAGIGPGVYQPRQKPAGETLPLPPPTPNKPTQGAAPPPRPSSPARK